MKYDADMFAHQLPIVEQFVQQLAYYRAARSVYDKLNLKSPFSCATIDAHLKIATINWCTRNFNMTFHLNIEGSFCDLEHRIKVC